MRFVRSCFVAAALLSFASAQAVELIIGEERVKPGVVFIFEGAVKDQVYPDVLHLPENETQVHIEARVNWGMDKIPNGAPAGGFVPYLHITAKVTNQKTGLSTFIDLLPHINLVDNFHYARNMSLPGSIEEPYTVTFTIAPPTSHELALHKDWQDQQGQQLMTAQQFTYKDIQFAEIARASRR
ncbi:MAG: iron transporter [Wenzhouxiangellaceae bacterium]